MTNQANQATSGVSIEVVGTDTKVYLDGHDITHHLHGYTISHTSQGLPEIELHLAPMQMLKYAATKCVVVSLPAQWEEDMEDIDG